MNTPEQNKNLEAIYAKTKIIIDRNKAQQVAKGDIAGSIRTANNQAIVENHFRAQGAQIP